MGGIHERKRTKDNERRGRTTVRWKNTRREVGKGRWISGGSISHAGVLVSGSCLAVVERTRKGDTAASEGRVRRSLYGPGARGGGG